MKKMREPHLLSRKVAALEARSSLVQAKLSGDISSIVKKLAHPTEMLTEKPSRLPFLAKTFPAH
jgi:hypothetical protein